MSLLAQEPDFLTTYNGTTCSLIPCTDIAKAWISENLQLESWQWLGRAVVIDTRFFNDILQGIIADGLNI